MFPPRIPSNFRNPAKGVGKFRPMKKVYNKILYGLLLVNGITTKELGERVGRSQRAVQNWINEGAVPDDPHIREEVAKVLEVPENIVWYQVKS